MAIIESDPSTVRPCSQYPLRTHSQGTHDTLDPTHTSDNFASLAGNSWHPLHRSLAIAVNVEQGDQVERTGEEGIRIVSGEEEGMWGDVLFCGRMESKGGQVEIVVRRDRGSKLDSEGYTMGGML
ncbi:MAG: hypothetical protein L6R39_000318 [Caloplaca ligustica]|nr:MAG: hypothetical protein L6R39_000318 [Caloplaca ligustica]